MISEKNVEWFNNSVMEESIEVSGLPDVGLVIDIDVVYDLMTQLEELEDSPQQPKTPTTINPKAFQHSYTKKEQNTTKEAVNDDKVNKPNHYVGVKGLEVEEVLQNFLPKYKDPYTSHRVGSAIEYQLRSPEKNGLEDLRKARKNLDQAIEYEESKVVINITGGLPTEDIGIELKEAMRAFGRIDSL